MQGLNLLSRLNELPRAAWKRLTASILKKMTRREFNGIIRGEVQRTNPENIQAFTSILKCSFDEFMNPSHIFSDFRTEEEKVEDINSQSHANSNSL